MSMRNIGTDDGDIGFEEEETTANDGPKYTGKIHVNLKNN